MIQAGGWTIKSVSNFPLIRKITDMGAKGKACRG